MGWHYPANFHLSAPVALFAFPLTRSSNGYGKTLPAASKRYSVGNSTDIWMPLYVGDYLSSTQHLSAEQSGAYLHLLMHSWKAGPLPLDLEVVRRIARIEKDAWSNAWVLLEPFFTRTENGYVQQRLDREKSISRRNREGNSARAKAAAEKRWARRELGVRSTAQGTIQALLDDCPSPSPSQMKQKQKPSRDKHVADPRHVEFREIVRQYWDHRNAPLEMPWDGSDAKALSRLLNANPTLDIAAFKQLLQERNKSQVNHAERPRAWLESVTNYARGALNTFNRPMEMSQNVDFAGKTKSSVDSARAAIEAIENRNAPSPTGNSQTSKTGDGRLPGLRLGS